MSTKIALDGVGGQGVRVIAGVMGALLARMGKAEVPAELAGEMDAVRSIEDKLHAQDREIAALEEEGAGRS